MRENSRKDVYVLTENGFSTVVEQITHNLTIKGFNPAMAGSRKIVGKM
jgi:hypothetical protein